MKFFKTAQNYVKGSTENLEDAETITSIDETSTQESTEMFYKNHWFRDGQEVEEETKDPWLPNMVYIPNKSNQSIRNKLQCSIQGINES